MAVLRRLETTAVLKDAASDAAAAITTRMQQMGAAVRGASDAMEDHAGAQRQAGTAVADTERKVASGTRELQRARDNVEPLGKALRRLAADKEAVNRAFTNGTITDNKTGDILSGNAALEERNRLLGLIAAKEQELMRRAGRDAANASALQSTTAAYGKLAVANDRWATSAAISEKSSHGLRNAMGQLGFQVQDVAVQLAGGQNAMLVFAQQGSQVAGAFGPMGAAIGAVIAVAGALGMAFGGLKSDTERLEDASKSYEKAAKSVDSTLKELVQSGRALRASHGEEVSSVAALEAQYRSLSGTMRELEALRLQVERNKVTTALADQRTVVKSLTSDLDGLETAVANVLDFQKLLNERRKAMGADALGDMPGSILKLRDALVSFKAAGADDPEAIARLAVSLNDAAKAGGPLSDTAKKIAESLVDPARNSADLAEKLKLVDGMARVLSGTATAADKALINMGDSAGKSAGKVRTLDDVLADVIVRGMADEARDAAKAWELLGHYADRAKTPAERYRDEVERVQAAMKLVQDRVVELGSELNALSPAQIQAITKALNDADPALQEFNRAVKDTAKDMAGDVTNALYDGMTGRGGLDKWQDFGKAIAKRIALGVLETRIVLPIMTQVVGAVPGLFGISSPANQTGTAAAGGGVPLLGGGGGIGGVNLGSLSGTWLDRQLGGGLTSANNWLNTPVMSNPFGGPSTSIMNGIDDVGQLGYAPGTSPGITGGDLLGAAGYGLNAFMNFRQGNVVGGIGNTAATAMMFIPGAQPFAPFVALGSQLLGGLFGNNNPPGREGLSFYDWQGDTYREGGDEGKKRSDANRQAAAQLQKGYVGLGEALEKMAGTARLAGDFAVGINDRGQLRTQVGADNRNFSNDEAGRGGAAGFLVGKWADELASGLGPSLTAAVKKIDFSDLQAGLGDLQFLSNFKQAQTALSEFDTSLAGIQAAAKKAATSGLEPFLKELDKADELGIKADYVAVAKGQLQNYLDALATPTDWSAGEQAIANFRGQMDALRDVSEKAGFGMAAAINAAEQAGLERLRRETQSNLNAALNEANGVGFINQLNAASDAYRANTRDLQALGMATTGATNLFDAQIRQILGGLNEDQLGIVIANFDGAIDTLATSMRRTAAATREAAEAAERHAQAVTRTGGRIAVEQAINPNWRPNLDARFAVAGLSGAPVEALRSTFQAVFDSAATGTATAAQMRAALTALDGQFNRGAITADQYNAAIGMLTSAWADSGNAAQAAAQALEAAAQAAEQTITRARAIRDFNADLLGRRQTLLGNSAGAALTRFDLDAARQIEGAVGQDVPALRAVLAAERAQQVFDLARADYLEQIDREIEARQTSTEALREHALRVSDIAREFRDAAADLRLSEAGDRSPKDLLDEYRRQFEDTLTAYRGTTDLDKREELKAKLLDAGQGRVNYADQFYQTTDYSDYRRVLAVFDELGIVADGAASNAEETIRQNDQIIKGLEDQRRAAERLGERQLGSLDGLRGAMEGAKATLDAQLAQLRATPAPQVNVTVNGSSVTTSTGGVSTVLTPEQRYLAANPDVAANAYYGTRAAEHYAIHGAREGRDGTGLTLTRDQQYLVNNPDVAAAVARGDYATGRDHYDRYGQAEGRRYATGGLVTGGPAGIDTVPAWLTNGERVLSVPHSRMMEAIYSMALSASISSRPADMVTPANDPMPPMVVEFRRPEPVPQPGATEQRETVELLRRLLDTITRNRDEAARHHEEIIAALSEVITKQEEGLNLQDEAIYEARKKRG